eukprot:227532_1
MSQLKALKDIVLKRKLIVAASSVFMLFCGRFIVNKIHRKIYRLPPGPEGLLPFIGYALHSILSKTWHINVAMTYGPIVYLKTLRGQTILINSSKIAKEVLKMSAMNYRETKFTPQITPLSAKDGTQSFALTNGNEWKTSRTLMHTKLIRILNTQFVNNIFSDSIKNDFEPYLNNIINKNSGIWYPREIATQLMFNTIFKANFGLKFDNTNKMHQDLLKGLDQVTSPQTTIKGAALVVFPFLKYITSFKSDLDRIKEINHDNINKLLAHYLSIKDDIMNHDQMSFIDYTIELRKNEEISEGREIADILLTFVAGTDTTANTFEYGMVLLGKQPEIQEIVRNEILSNVNKNTNEIIYDINVLLKVPHFRALIHEILRISSIAKIGGPHYIAHKDLFVNNYRFPKGSTVFYNTDYIHNYSKNENWTYDTNNNQKQICLENWLKNDSDGNCKFYQNESFILFGEGKRDCVGRQLALKEMRILVGYMLLNYQLKLENKNQLIHQNGGSGFGIARIEPQIPVILKKISNKT